jgi:hypothetical protein
MPFRILGHRWSQTANPCSHKRRWVQVSVCALWGAHNTPRRTWLQARLQTNPLHYAHEAMLNKTANKVAVLVVMDLKVERVLVVG